MIKKTLLRFLFSAPIALLAANTLHAADQYNFLTINNPGDPNFNQLLGINNSGEIAGYFGDGNVLPNKGYTTTAPYRSFTAENFPQSVQTQVVGINNASTPVTVGFYIDGNNNNFGFVNQAGNFTSVSSPNTPTNTPTTNQLLGVNDHGIAAGFYNDMDGNAHGYTYNIAANSFANVVLPGSFVATANTATGVDNAGDIVGFYVNGTGQHGFLDVAGNIKSLDDPNGTNTMILGVNNNNQLVGSFVDGNGITNGFVYNWATSTWQTVDDPYQSSTAAFNVTGTTINGINDRGQIVGFFSDGTNVNGFLATATPEPADFALLALGGGLLLTWRRANRKTA
jgi:hypothetical protein